MVNIAYLMELSFLSSLAVRLESEQAFFFFLLKNHKKRTRTVAPPYKVSSTLYVMKSSESDASVEVFNG